MAKSKITIELENEVIEKIKELLNKYNESPLSKEKMESIEQYVTKVISSQVMNMDKMNERLVNSFKKLADKLKDFDLGDFDIGDMFGDSKKDAKKPTVDSNTENKKYKN